MSLHTAAQHLAGQGRFNDSMLVHMNPKEFERISDYAESMGRHLTVNPKTGLPEMWNVLDKISGVLGTDGGGGGLLGGLRGVFGSKLGSTLLPIVAGLALGPAGLGLTALQAGAAVGAGTWGLTGDLRRGISAGLGAYGGSSLGSSFANFAGSGGSATSADAIGQIATAETPAAVSEIVASQPTGFAAAGEGLTGAWEGVKAAAVDPAGYWEASGGLSGNAPALGALYGSYNMAGDEGGEGPSLTKLSPDASPVELQQYEYIQDLLNPGVGVSDKGERLRYAGRYAPKASISYKPYSG